MKEYSCLTEDQARFYCAQLVLALRHMQEKHNIVYVTNLHSRASLRN